MTLAIKVMSASRIYIGRISSRVSEKDVEHFFRGYGRIKDILLKNGFGFVEFDDRRDAEDAVYDLNGKELAGERVVLDYSKPRGGGFISRSDRGSDRDRDRGSSSRYGSRGGGGGFGGPRRESRYGRPYSTRHRAIVENLSSRVSWQDLKDEIRKSGVEPTYAEAHKKPNEALVCFSTSDDLRRCIDKCDGLELNGRKIKVIDDSRPGGSRSRSRSRDNKRRSRSRSRGSSRSSKSRSRSPRRRRASRSRSRSVSRDRSRSAERRSRSRSPPAKKSSPTRSESRSRSPRKQSRSPRRDSRSPRKDSRSPSASPRENGDN